jgi:hypothetical protein
MQPVSIVLRHRVTPSLTLPIKGEGIRERDAIARLSPPPLWGRVREGGATTPLTRINS